MQKRGGKKNSALNPYILRKMRKGRPRFFFLLFTAPDWTVNEHVQPRDHRPIKKSWWADCLNDNAPSAYH